MFGLSDIEVVRMSSSQPGTPSQPAGTSVSFSDTTENLMLEKEKFDMKFEDLKSAYLRLEERSSQEISELKTQFEKVNLQVKSNRERALLKQKMDKFDQFSREPGNSVQLQKLFEEIAIGYWLLTKEGTQVNRHLQTYVRALLQGNDGSEGPQEPGDFRKLMETIARLKREVTEKDLALSMCVVHLNKLSSALSTLSGQELPLIQKYPELELPELCKALSRLLSRQIAKTPVDTDTTPRTYFDTAKYVRDRKRGLTRVIDPENAENERENVGREVEMCMEEALFERDLARKQNSILRQCTGEKLPEREKLALFELLSAKEENLRIQLDIVAEERGHLAKEKADFRAKSALKSNDMAKLEAMNERLTKLLMVKKVDMSTGMDTTMQSKECGTEDAGQGSNIRTVSVVCVDQICDTEGLVTMVDTPCEPAYFQTHSKKVGVESSQFSVSKGINTITKVTCDRGVTATSHSITGHEQVKVPPIPLAAEASRPPRYRDSPMRKAISKRDTAVHAEVMASAAKILSAAEKNVGMIERHWNHINAKKMQESITERKNCITPLRELQSAMMRRKGTMSPYTDFDAEEMEELRLDGARSCIGYAEDMSDISFSSAAAGIPTLDFKDDPYSQLSSGQRTPLQLADYRHSESSFKSDSKPLKESPQKPIKSALKRVSSISSRS